MSEASRTVEMRITDYLCSGGLFNPELANHDAVRDLLIDARDALTAERERADRNQEDAERYRWLKDGVWDDRLTRIIELRMNAIWDAAIDAARRK